MTCPTCGNKTLLIYENGGQFDCCFYCGHKTERIANDPQKGNPHAQAVLPELLEGIAEELARDDLLP